MIEIFKPTYNILDLPDFDWETEPGYYTIIVELLDKEGEVKNTYFADFKFIADESGDGEPLLNLERIYCTRQNVLSGDGGESFEMNIKEGTGVYKNVFDVLDSEIELKIN